MLAVTSSFMKQLYPILCTASRLHWLIHRQVGGRHNAVAWLLLLHPELDPNAQVQREYDLQFKNRKRLTEIMMMLCNSHFRQDEHGFTALHIACGRNNAWAVARIGRHPAFNSINALDEEGCTALMEAASFGHTECVRTMLALPGVQLGLKDGLGRGLEEIARWCFLLIYVYWIIFQGIP